MPSNEILIFDETRIKFEDKQKVKETINYYSGPNKNLENSSGVFERQSRNIRMRLKTSTVKTLD